MTVDELIKELKQYRGNLKVVVQDGMDPSDWEVATRVELKEDIYVPLEDDRKFVSISP